MPRYSKSTASGDAGEERGRRRGYDRSRNDVQKLEPNVKLSNLKAKLGNLINTKRTANFEAISDLIEEARFNKATFFDSQQSAKELARLLEIPGAKRRAVSVRDITEMGRHIELPAWQGPNTRTMAIWFQCVHRLKVMEFEPKELLVTEGGMQNCAYWLLTGEAELLTEANPKGTKAAVWQLLNEGALQDRPATCTVRAVDTVKVAALDVADYDDIVNNVSRSSYEGLRGVGLLLTSRTKRTTAELQELGNWLKVYELFTTMEEEFRTEVMSLVEYMSVPAGFILFEEGDKVDFCYVILQGSVSFTRFSDQTKKLEDIGSKSTGEHFGTLITLSGAERKRPFTSTCTVPTEMAVISRASYNRVIRKSLHHTIEERVELLKSLAILKSDTQATLQRVAVSCSDLTLPPGVVVVDAADPPPRIFFVAKGECRLVWQTDTLDLPSFDQPIGVSYLSSYGVLQQQMNASTVMHPNGAGMPAGFAPKRHTIEVARLGRGDLINGALLLDKLPILSVSTCSQVKLMALDIGGLDSFLGRDALALLRALAAQQHEWMKSHMKTMCTVRQTLISNRQGPCLHPADYEASQFLDHFIPISASTVPGARIPHGSIPSELDDIALSTVISGSMSNAVRGPATIPRHVFAGNVATSLLDGRGVLSNSRVDYAERSNDGMTRNEWETVTVTAKQTSPGLLRINEEVDVTAVAAKLAAANHGWSTPGMGGEGEDPESFLEATAAVLEESTPFAASAAANAAATGTAAAASMAGSSEASASTATAAARNPAAAATGEAAASTATSTPAASNAAAASGAASTAEVATAGVHTVAATSSAGASTAAALEERFPVEEVAREPSPVTSYAGDHLSPRSNRSASMPVPSTSAPSASLDLLPPIPAPSSSHAQRSPLGPEQPSANLNALPGLPAIDPGGPSVNASLSTERRNDSSGSNNRSRIKPIRSGSQSNIVTVTREEMEALGLITSAAGSSGSYRSGAASVLSASLPGSKCSSRQNGLSASLPNLSRSLVLPLIESAWGGMPKDEELGLHAMRAAPRCRSPARTVMLSPALKKHMTIVDKNQPAWKLKQSSRLTIMRDNTILSASLDNSGHVSLDNNEAPPAYGPSRYRDALVFLPPMDTLDDAHASSTTALPGSGGIVIGRDGKPIKPFIKGHSLPSISGRSNAHDGGSYAQAGAAVAPVKPAAPPPAITQKASFNLAGLASAMRVAHAIVRISHMKRGGLEEPELPLDRDEEAPVLQDHRLSAPTLDDINYILKRWGSRWQAERRALLEAPAAEPNAADAASTVIAQRPRSRMPSRHASRVLSSDLDKFGAPTESQLKLAGSQYSAVAD